MSIQFCCSGCGQPIEVDNEHAGKVAACPYCQHVVTVPMDSTYEPTTVPTARPTPDAPPPGHTYASYSPQPSSLHVGPAPYDRQRTARRLGNFALISAAIAVVLLIVSMAVSPKVALDKLVPETTTQPVSPEETARSQREQLRETLSEFEDRPELLMLNCGFLFFAGLGLILGIISVAMSRRGNWPGIAALVASGCFVLLICVGIVAQLLLMGGALQP